MTKLNELHTQLCEELIKRLAAGDECPPATLNIIRQFLKDTGTTGQVDDESELTKLMNDIDDPVFKEAFRELN